MSAPEKGAYGEPWSVGPYYKTDVETREGRAAECRLGTPDGAIKAARIVACVNALNGRDPEALDALVKAAQAAEATLGRSDYCSDFELDAARDVLRAALAAFGGSK
jgi:hypothetical protein